MERMVVSVFDSRHKADSARRRLLEHGFDDTRIRVEGGGASAGSEHGLSGISGVVERVFSGLFPLDDEVAQYAQAVRSGKSLVALHVSDDAAAANAALILREANGEVVPPRGTAAASAAVPDYDDKGSLVSPRDVDPTATAFSPRVYPLPDSPSGWNTTLQGEQGARDILTDALRRDGNVNDAHGLDTDGARDNDSSDK
jgi:hypothetical protein